MDEIGVLYEKILDNQNWEMDDLDKLLELVRAEGYICGRLSNINPDYTIQEAANKELIHSNAMVVKGCFMYNKEAMLNMFYKGSMYKGKENTEHITIEQAYITGARDTKKRAVKELRIALEKWVHGNKADCVIEAFEELINK